MMNTIKKILVSICIVVTLITKPTDKEGLKDFYRKVRPAGPGWKSIAEELSQEGEDISSPDHLKPAFVGWISAVIFLMTVFYGTGKLLLQEFLIGMVLMVIAVLSLLVLLKTLKKIFY